MMTAREVLEHNASYWECSADQAREIQAWLAVRMSDWPSWLSWAVGAKSKGQPVCGDALGCWVAEAVKDDWGKRKEAGR